MVLLLAPGGIALALRQASDLSAQPQHMYSKLGRLYLQLGQPREALAAFDRAISCDFLQDDSSPLAAEFHAAVAAGRGRAWWALGDAQRATMFQEQAVRFTPSQVGRWKDLADLYQLQGRNVEAQQAMQRTKQ